MFAYIVDKCFFYLPLGYLDIVRPLTQYDDWHLANLRFMALLFCFVKVRISVKT